MRQHRALSVVALCVLGRATVWAEETKVLGPSGEVLIAPSANELEQLESPQLAPAEGASPSQVQADCLIEDGTFYGSDFLATKNTSAASASDCCAACKLATDCTVWNWCGDKAGCPLPPNLAMAGGNAQMDYQTCIWKPRPLNFAGTLPEPPTANRSQAYSGWTSGIPINGTLLPALQGFEMTPGIEMGYSDETDFFCTGSSTSKPVCQLYGNAKGGALACLNNPICRGFQICWAFPTGADFYSQTGIIRLKAGAEAPLNISTSLQNPYCSVYVLKSGTASSPSSGESGYSLRDATNITAVSAAKSKLGRRLMQAPAANNFSKTSTTGSGGSSINSMSRPQIISIAPSQSSPVAAVSAPTPKAPAPAPSASAGRAGTNITSPFLGDDVLRAFNNATFNYTQCYSDAPTIRVTLQSQQFPLRGRASSFSLHTWTEIPFRNSGDVCCAFKDEDDYFLDLETGELAKTLPTYVVTDSSLSSGPALKDYDTTPTSIASPVAYVPVGQMNNPAAGQGRQFTFPSTNSSEYVNALEQLYFSLSQVALGNRFCTPGTPQLASAVNFVGGLLSELSEENQETPSGVPLEFDFIASSIPNPDGSFENASCLVEQGALYEGEVIKTISNGSGTAEACCKACWLFYDIETNAACDLWTLNSQNGSCQLKNSTLAADFQPVSAERGSEYQSYTSGRRTAVLPSTTSNIFALDNL